MAEFGDLGMLQVKDVMSDDHVLITVTTHPESYYPDALSVMLKPDQVRGLIDHLEKLLEAK